MGVAQQLWPRRLSDVGERLDLQARMRRSYSPAAQRTYLEATIKKLAHQMATDEATGPGNDNPPWGVHGGAGALQARCSTASES